MGARGGDRRQRLDRRHLGDRRPFPNTRVVHRPFDSHALQWSFAVSETGRDQRTGSCGWTPTTWWSRRCATRSRRWRPAGTAAYGSPSPTASMAGRCGPRSIRRCPSCSAGARGALRAGRSYRAAAASTDRSCRLHNRLLHDDRKSLERWLQSQSRYQAAGGREAHTRPWSELSWPDRLRRTRVLGPVAVAVHCLFVKGLVFDGSAGFFYTAQRVTADMILSLHLLRSDLAVPNDLRPRASTPITPTRRPACVKDGDAGRRRRGGALPAHQALGRLPQRIDPLLPGRSRHLARRRRPCRRQQRQPRPTAGASSAMS